MPTTVTTSNETQTTKSADGYAVGQTAADLVGFYGATPIAQPSGSSQAAVSSLLDLSGGTANWSTSIITCTATYTSATINNIVATLVQAINNQHTLLHAIRTAQVNLGTMKGSS